MVLFTFGTVQISLIQLVASVFALFALSRVLLRTYKREITQSECFFWSTIWLAIIILALLPHASTFLANLTGLQRGADALLFGGILLLFYLTFRLYVKIEQNQQAITKLVREIALNKKK